MVSQVLRLNHPCFAPATARHAVQYPKVATVEAQALFQILSHATRRRQNQQRVIGTLLGTRSEDGSIVEVKYAYIIPVTEDAEEVTVEVQYHNEMYALLRKSHPEFLIVGWYSTSPELNNMSALIHQFFTDESGSFPRPPVHVTIDPAAENISLEAYVALPLWASPENQVNGNCIFAPITSRVKFDETDKPMLGLASAIEGADIYDLAHSTDDAIESTIKQIDIVLAKIAETRHKGDNSPEADALARYLFKVVANAPELEAPSTTMPHKVQPNSKFDPRSAMYKAYMGDLVTIVNLTNCIRWQVQLTSEVSSNLA